MKKNDNLLPLIIIAFVVLSIIPALLPLLIIGGLAYYINNKKEFPYKVKNQNMNTNMNIEQMGVMVKRVFGGFTFLIIAAVVLFNMVVIVPAGQTGVHHLFGDVRKDELSSGIHLINPFATVVMMSIRTEQYTMSIAPGEGQRIGDDAIDALTKEGLNIRLDMTVLYRLDETQASDVYRELGFSFEEKVLRPQVRSVIREVIALYEAKDIYSEKREEAASKIFDILSENLITRGIIVEDVLLRNIALPQMLTKEIEAKLVAEQEAQKYDFVLQREEKEAERKRIEAEGQRDAQSLINQSLTDRYLQYLYVQGIKDREGTIYVPTNMPLLKSI